MTRHSSSSAASQASSTTSAEAISTEVAKASSSGDGGDGDGASYFGVLFQRLAMCMGIVYVVTEYGIEWTVCEGPSMMPTIKPSGEIVVIDLFTPQLCGLNGGDTVAKRTDYALRMQDKHVEGRKQKMRNEKEWMLRLYRQEEEKLELKEKENREQNKSDVGREGSESIQQPLQKSSTATDFPDSNPNHTLLERESQPPSTIETNHGDGSSISDSKEILKAIREDIERIGHDFDEETWFETRIPVNKLPPEGAWDRFRTQITTGISVGDVVVLQHPDRIGTVCKRVAGLPGDIVTKPSSRLGGERTNAMLHGGREGRSLSQGYSALDLGIELDRKRRNRRTKRHLLNSGIKVPSGHIWVEGDNPWNSSDSRNYGAVPASLIMGRVLLRLWPLRGRALMERGERPVRSDEDELTLAYSGSIVIPAGWDDQRIVCEFVPESQSPLPAEPPAQEK